MNSFFKTWMEQEKHKNKLFITDGVVDEEKWNSTDIKILFLLKEAYHSNKSNLSGNSWDLIDKHVKIKLAGTKTFKPLGQWAYGIQGLKNTGDILPLPQVTRKKYKDHLKSQMISKQDIKGLFNEALKSTAIVNIKKSNGYKTSNVSDLQSYVASDWDDFIKPQIDKLNPDIVVCCSTWKLIKNKLLNGDPLDYRISEGCYEYGNTLYVNYYHPAYQIPNMMKYYALTSLIKQSGFL